MNLIAVTSLAMSLFTSSMSAFTVPWSPTPVPPPPDKIVVEVVTVNGSGCPQGTAAVAASDDRTSFTVTYSAFLAQAGGDSKSIDARKNCQINVRVHVPQGFTYAIASVDYRGFAHLEPGSTGLEQANYYFQGMSPTAYVKHPLAAPLDDNWENTDSTDLAAMVWSPCGEQRLLNINTELRVSPGSDASKVSYVNMDSTDGQITTTYHFAWANCPH